jgi:lauroyl/myristoyl acyltransferase
VSVAFAGINVYGGLARRARLGSWLANVEFHEQLLRCTTIRGTEEEVAQRAVTEYFCWLEIFWRPWLMARGEVSGIEWLREAESQGRGVVLAFPHYGNPYAVFVISAQYSLGVRVVASPHHYEDLGRGYNARFARRGRRYLELLGKANVIPRAGGKLGAQTAFPLVEEALNSGAIVSMSFDSVGSLPTPFLGRVIRLTSGPARLALSTGAMIVPCVARRRGAIPVLLFGPPLDPHDYDDELAIQAAIARQMEAWALERPEAVWPLDTQPGGSPLIGGQQLE